MPDSSLPTGRHRSSPSAPEQTSLGALLSNDPSWQHQPSELLTQCTPPNSSKPPTDDDPNTVAIPSWRELVPIAFQDALRPDVFEVFPIFIGRPPQPKLDGSFFPIDPGVA